jgi:hypothetical protein
MKVHCEAEVFIRQLDKRGEPMTIRQIVRSGAMDSREASNAAQYASRHGAIKRVVVPETACAERRRYGLTGLTLPLRDENGSMTFEALLAAWNIPCGPPPRGRKSATNSEE